MNVENDGVKNKLLEWFFSFTIITRTCGFICIFVYIWGLFFEAIEQNTCLSFDTIYYDYQFWRIFTSPFVHFGFMHLLFNMMTFQGLGPFVERSLGSFKMAYLMLLSIIMGGIMQVTLEWLALEMKWVETDNCSLGFSGLIFTLIVVECKESNEQQKSLFYGFFKVPTAVYPPILLIVTQVLFSSVSFVGHLSGMVMGYLYVYGVLNIITPSSQTIEYWESNYLQKLVRLTGYISNTGNSNYYLETNSWPSLIPSFSRKKPFVPFQGEGFSLSNSTNNKKGVVEYEGTKVEMPDRDIESLLDERNNNNSFDSVMIDDSSPVHHPQHNSSNQSENLLELSRTLMSMGYSREDSLKALAKSNGDINVALDLLKK